MALNRVEAGGPKHTSRVGVAVLAAVLLMAGCATRAPAPAPPAATPARDGPEAKPPAHLASLPDAEPRIEPIRPGGPNKPYEVLGERYAPITDDAPRIERGLASWYGRKFHGRPTASGEIYNMYAMTAAHTRLPIPSFARVRNPANGREVIVRINDRGPFHAGRIIDLSYTAALKLDVLRGVAPVEVVRITQAEIRAGLSAPLYVPAEASAAPERESTAARAQSAAARGFWAQLGSFKSLDEAESLRRRWLEQDLALAPWLTIVRERGLHKLQAGPYAQAEEARTQWREAPIFERR
jgi:rare lipoprotein A